MIYDLNLLITKGGFKNWNEVSNHLLNEFHRTDDYAEKMEIIEFIKRNNIDIIKLTSSDEIIPFEQPRQTMTTQEIKQNIEEISKPADIVPPVDDKVKEILE